MKPYEELTPQQQFIRKSSARLALYGAVALGCLWGIGRVVKWQEEDNASARRIEATMMEYYRETKHQPDTAGMASYMKERLSLGDYELWRRSGA